MNMKQGIRSLVVVIGVMGVAACESTPQTGAADERKAGLEAKEKIAMAEKEAAEKTAKAKQEAAEKIAAAGKDLAEKKVEAREDLAQELTDIKYQTFVGLRDYKTLVTNRLDDNEKKFIDLKTKFDGKATTMSEDVRREWSESVKVAELELSQARRDLKLIDTATETSWSTVKGRVDNNLKNFVKSVETLSKTADK